MRSALRITIRRTALLATALSALGMAPAVAEAATVRVDGGVLRYLDQKSLFGSETNGVRLGVQGGEFVVTDTAGLRPGPGCRTLAVGSASCGGSATQATMLLGRGNDTAVVDASIPVTVNGGDGTDRLLAGRPEAAPTSVTFFGNAGNDTVSYVFATSGVTVTKDGLANDGRPGDADNIQADVETIEGSRFSDSLAGSNVGERFTGGAGDDTVFGLGGNDLLVPSKTGDGADDFSGGPGSDTATYIDRPAPVRVSLDDIADDGEAGEGDNIRSDVEIIGGTEHDDTLIGSPEFNFLDAFGGDDLIDGKGGGDLIRCRAGIDEAFFYPGDTREECEGIGSFRLSPRRTAVRVGRPLALTLRWTHPVSWRRLDEVVLVLKDRGRRAGRIVLEPGARRVHSTGRNLSLAGPLPHIRTRRGGRAVRVRLSLRFGGGLAGRTLIAKLGATQDDGARQEPARAGRIRVLAR